MVDGRCMHNGAFIKDKKHFFPWVWCLLYGLILYNAVDCCLLPLTLFLRFYSVILLFHLIADRNLWNENMKVNVGALLL